MNADDLAHVVATTAVSELSQLYNSTCKQSCTTDANNRALRAPARVPVSLWLLQVPTICAYLWVTFPLLCGREIEIS
jgi:hypothetical protein